MTTQPPPGSVEVDFISPRHLAGGGDPAWVTVPLHRACGWSHGNDPLMPRVVLSSPDHHALLRLEPDPDNRWWTLVHAPGPARRPAWFASFGARTPVELIAAVTDALTDPSAQANAPCDPYERLLRAGWARNAGGIGSPDGTADIRRLGTADSPGAWLVTVKLGVHQPVWQARFGDHTPPHLIGAFTSALADPAPLLRIGYRNTLPVHDPALITRRSEAVRADFAVAALEARVRALAARRARPPAPLSPGQPARNRRR
ncbi:DUF317 domain-containing protein [Streptomyces phytophilus]|uniref:DUF317 domain-containing protein n=1 Tax=Streptomyces phytophilus TaxID=722715 RepID=UPI0015F0F21C|nr:DUF317 domain-containing protein [Streptomyces phytophilus]